MLKAMSVTLCLMMASSLALAQDGFKKSFDFADFEVFIKEDLKKDFAKKQGEDVALYDIKETPYLAMFNKKTGIILFSARLKSNATTDKMNDWNRDAIYSRAYVTNGVAIFEVCMSIAGGCSRDIAKGYYVALEKEFQAFQKFLGGGN